MARPISTSPDLQSHTTPEDSSETRIMLPAHLSVPQKNINYVSPYQPVTQKSSKEIPAPASSSRTSEPERNASSKAIRSANPFLREWSSPVDIAKLIKSLESQNVNTLIGLRRIETLLMGTGRTPHIIKALTRAWAHYVNSNNLLSELRGLTSNSSFSSECLDEAKWMVISDTSSSRSWNYCWLVLQKVKNENLITKHARQQAFKPVMWGGKKPTSAQVEQLATVCTSEWTRAVNQLLRHWEMPPTM